MSSGSKKRKRRSFSQNAFIVVGVIMAGSMALSLIIPLLSSSQNTSTTNPTPTFDPNSDIAPTVVFPEPVENPEIGFSGTFIHPSGAFIFPALTDWEENDQVNSTLASVTYTNYAAYSVVHAYVQKFEGEQDLDSLGAYFNADELASTWANYDDWFERNREVQDDRLLLDFDLVLSTQSYLGRHVTWPVAGHPDWAQVLRVVVPGNNPPLLNALTEAVVPRFQVLPEELNTSLLWEAYTDPIYGFAIKLEEGWSVVDGGTGRTTTAEYETGEASITLAMQPDAALADEAAARDWVTALRPNAEFLAAQPEVRPSAEGGFALAYTYTIPDGAGRSGLAVLLNGADGRLVSANVVLRESGVNLLDGEGEVVGSAIAILDTLALLPAANLPDPTPTPQADSAN